MCWIAIAKSATINSVNKINDDMGNFVASIVSTAGSGNINQGDDGNKGVNTYTNSIQRDGYGDLDINAIAGNEEAALYQNSDYDDIIQNDNGNNNMDNVRNLIKTGDNASHLNFNVENINAKTQHGTGNNTVAQVHDNNNASNQFSNYHY